MPTHKEYRRGQSTFEFALILPIIAFLLGMIIQIYRINQTSNEESINFHIEALEKFDYGKGLVWDEDQQVFVPAGGYSEFVPPDALFNPSDIANTLIPQLTAQLGLDELFGRINFFNGDKFVGSFARGFSYSAASSFINSDFTSVDWESATWAGFASGFSSNETTQFLQGTDFENGSLRELVGSGVQSGLVSYSQSQGDVEAGLTGVVSGMVGSDTTQDWMNSDNQIAKAALVGALESSANGVIHGDFDIKDVATAAGLRALGTDQLASALPFTSWSGGSAKDSAFYRGVNAGLSNLIQGGDAKTAVLSTLGGAINSPQARNSISSFSSSESSTWKNALGPSFSTSGVPGVSTSAAAGALQSSAAFGSDPLFLDFGNSFDSVGSVEQANAWIENFGFGTLFPPSSSESPLNQTLSGEEQNAIIETLILNGYLSSFPPGVWS
ncbi:MAG: hypothetical protein R3A11_05575 [Bdellovibrionota bacterium]